MFYFYGVFNLRYGRTRILVYHLVPGKWYLSRWNQVPAQGYWADMGRISPRLGMKLIARLKKKDP